jgi:hypothetical protein
MNLVRIVFVALAVLLPTAWTIAKAAEDEAPAGEKSGEAKGKSSKKSKKQKKGEGEKTDTEKKSDPEGK